jgi:hypothetical protein
MLAIFIGAFVDCGTGSSVFSEKSGSRWSPLLHKPRNPLQPILPVLTIPQRTIGFPGFIVAGRLASKNDIFLEIHQTRKTPTADTTGR